MSNPMMTVQAADPPHSFDHIEVSIGILQQVETQFPYLFKQLKDINVESPPFAKGLSAGLLTLFQTITGVWGNDFFLNHPVTTDLVANTDEGFGTEEARALLSKYPALGNLPETDPEFNSGVCLAWAVVDTLVSDLTGQPETVDASSSYPDIEQALLGGLGDDGSTSNLDSIQAALEVEQEPTIASDAPIVAADAAAGNAFGVLRQTLELLSNVDLIENAGVRTGRRGDTTVLFLEAQFQQHSRLSLTVLTVVMGAMSKLAQVSGRDPEVAASAGGVVCVRLEL